MLFLLTRYTLEGWPFVLDTTFRLFLVPCHKHPAKPAGQGLEISSKVPIDLVNLSSARATAGDEISCAVIPGFDLDIYRTNRNEH